MFKVELSLTTYTLLPSLIHSNALYKIILCLKCMHLYKKSEEIFVTNDFVIMHSPAYSIVVLI